MKGRVLCFLVSVGLAVVISGCATTDDPRQGGLFGYNPKAYDQRIADREARLEALEKEQAREEEKTGQLKAELEEKQSQRDLYAQRVEEMERQIHVIEQTLAAAKLETAEKQRRYTEISEQLEQAKRQTAVARDSGADTQEAAKLKEIDRLNVEIDRLLEEAEALSTM